MTQRIGLTLERVPGFKLTSEGEDTVQSGKLAGLTGVSTDTLRHYERLGLLAKPPRTNGGYRDYPARSIERVQLIRRALSVGFSLPDLTTILKMRDGGEVPCHKVRSLAESKLQGVKQQIKDLLVMRDQLERILKDWDARLARSGRGKPARLLESLPDKIIPDSSRWTTIRKRRVQP